MESLQLIYDAHALYLWLGLLVLFVILAVWVVLVHLRLSSVVAHYRLLRRGVAGERLDQLIEEHLQRLDDTAGKLDEVARFCRELEVAQERSLQRIGTVRFNPFTEVGGDQSFSVAILDAKGDGVVLSSLFARHESRVYLKPIEKGHSKYALSGEEQEAIEIAAGQAANHRGPEDRSSGARSAGQERSPRRGQRR